MGEMKKEEQQPHVVGDRNNQNRTDISRFKSLLSSPDRDYLLSSTGAQVNLSDLEDKVIGLYFAANWYSPCGNFTRILSGAYDQLKTNGSKFEIVFVSSDEDLNAFNDFFTLSMPWLAIPFSDLETKKALNLKYEVEGIPCLVILQPNDNKEEATLCDGVELVYRYGVEAFPFTKTKLEALEMEEKEMHEKQTLMNLLTNHDRDYVLGHPTSNQVPVASLVGKTIGLYFSAKWCLPCLKFTPKLTSIHDKIKQSLTEKPDNDFDIVFISNDHNQTEFESYFDQMPWLTLPFNDPNIKTLTKHFDVRGIPCLIILGPDGKTVTKQGRNLVNLYQENAYPFTDDKVELLERQVGEEAKMLPRSVSDLGHRHELNLVSEGTGGGPFICCCCDEQGFGWAYQCLDCGYEVHTKCVRPSVGEGGSNYLV